VARIAAIVAQKAGDRRSILQLGYNLGRLSELTGLGREPFWDRWKTPVETWDVAELERLVQELQIDTLAPRAIPFVDTLSPTAQRESQVLTRPPLSSDDREPTT
jgi:hypothetical protein